MSPTNYSDLSGLLGRTVAWDPVDVVAGSGTARSGEVVGYRETPGLALLVLLPDGSVVEVSLRAVRVSA